MTAPPGDCLRGGFTIGETGKWFYFKIEYYVFVASNKIKEYPFRPPSSSCCINIKQSIDKIIDTQCKTKHPAK